MQVKRMDLVKRQGGYFHKWNGEKVKAVYPKQGYCVMVFFEESLIDTDFKEFVWCPSAQELRRLADLLDESDKLTYDMLGHGWAGERPYMRLEELL
jgi:hypothetical protein